MHSSPPRILYEARLWSPPHWVGWCGCRRGDRAPSITLPAVSPRLLLAACFTGRSVKTGRALPAVLRPTKIKHLNIYIEYSQHICISLLWLIREHVSSGPVCHVAGCGWLCTRPVNTSRNFTMHGEGLYSPTRACLLLVKAPTRHYVKQAFKHGKWT